LNFNGKKAMVIGGSIGGLTTALLLRDLGFSVKIFERTPVELTARGGGIVLQPESMRWFEERSKHNPEELSTASSFMRHIGDKNSVIYEEPAIWKFASWGSIQRNLLDDFGRLDYHLNEFACGFSQNTDFAEVRFVSGRVEKADLVVFADGISSTARKRLLPESTFNYSGYIGWRGLVPELDVEKRTQEIIGDALCYATGYRTHICMYPIPGSNGELKVGERLLNYVWYRNVPEGPELEEILTDTSGFSAPISIHPGKVQERYVKSMKESALSDLPPAAADLVNKTKEPFIQVVGDVRVSQMAFGRVALIGDAAFAARPHAAAGTAKAAEDAWSLSESLEKSNGDVMKALETWNTGRVDLGNNLVDRVIEMGRRAQVENSWDAKDPYLRFGLRGPSKL
jgi:2,6-dihydroxypyridine 3-monooxygenase